MTIVLRYSILFFVLNLVQRSQSNDICTIKSTRDQPLVCKSFKDCPAAVSNLVSGIDQIPCKIPNKNGQISQSVNNFSGFCCPTRRRISAQKCEEYTEVLQYVPTVTPFLPPDFLPTITQREIKCPQPLNSLIVNGRAALPEEFPHMAALGFEKVGELGLAWLCGGTLISDEYVLTAAHCVETRVGNPSKVLLGDIQLEPGNRDHVSMGKFKGSRNLIGISKIIKHPEYKPPLTYNDIALLKLERKVNFSRAIIPGTTVNLVLKKPILVSILQFINDKIIGKYLACLPQPEYRLERNKIVNATGWGQTGHAEAQSTTLQAVNLERFSFKECNDYFKDQPDKNLKFPNGIIRKQICVGDKSDKSQDTCRGDSGGPITATKDKRCIFYIVGITSFGSTLCGYQAPAIYTNVQSYLPWIENIVWPTE